MSTPVSDDLKHKQLYLLEVLVKTVEISSDESNLEQDLRPLFVRVKFLDFPYLEITRRDFLKDKTKDVDHNLVDVTGSIDDENEADASRKQGSKEFAGELPAEGAEPKEEAPPEDPSTFNIGKSCMFPMLPLELIKQIQRYPLTIQIFHKNEHDEYDLIGGARVRLGPDFEDLIIEAGEEYTQLPVSNILESEFPVKDIFGVPIGKMGIFIRLSCYGVTIVNQFQLIGEKGEYMFRNDRKDNTLQAQKKRSFIFGNEPYATASLLGKLVHPNDVSELKPIVTTEENILPIKGVEAFQEDQDFDTQKTPWKKHSEKLKFVNKAGEYYESNNPSIWDKRKAMPDHNHENFTPLTEANPKILALIETLLKDVFPVIDSDRKGQKTTCCDDCCDAKAYGKDNAREDKHHAPKYPEGVPYYDSPFQKFFFESISPISWIKNNMMPKIDDLLDSETSAPAFQLIRPAEDAGKYDQYNVYKPPSKESKIQKIFNESQNNFGFPKSNIVPDNDTDVIDPETLAWIKAILMFRDILLNDGYEGKNGKTHPEDGKKYDRHPTAKLPGNVPYPLPNADEKYGHFNTSTFNSNVPSTFGSCRNAFKEKDDGQCLFAKRQKSPITKTSLESNPTCHLKEACIMKDTAGKRGEVPDAAKNTDSNATATNKKDNQNEKHPDIGGDLESTGEKTLDLKPENHIKADQSVWNTVDDRVPKDVPKDLEILNINSMPGAQQVKSDSELTKRSKCKAKRKDSAELFRESLGKLKNKKLPKEERKPGSQSARMRKKYMSIYNYTDGMYPGIHVGHRHCAHLSRNVPKSMGWLWNTTESGDGLKKRRGWKPGAINKTIANMIKMTKVAAGIEVAVEEQPKKGVKKPVRKVRRPISAGSGTTSTNEHTDDDDYDSSPLPPTLHVHKKDGVYFISMNPLRLEDDDDEQVPLMFKIDADPSTSSSESSLEIECTAPGALRRRQIKPPPACQDKQTATEDV